MYTNESPHIDTTFYVLFSPFIFSSFDLHIMSFIRPKLGKLSNRKSNETWELVQSGDAPPPLAGLGLF